MNDLFVFIRSHGTKILGFLGITIGVLAVADPELVGGPKAIKYYLLAQSLLTVWRGFFNTDAIADAVVSRATTDPIVAAKVMDTVNKASGFARVSMLLTLVGLGIVGCSLTQKQTVTKNFNQLLSDAVAIDDGIVVLGTSMLNSGAITSSQAKQVLAVTDKIKGVLDAARDAYAAGNVILANSQLSAATGDLVTAQSCTGATDRKVTLDSCLAPIGGAP